MGAGLSIRSLKQGFDQKYTVQGKADIPGNDLSCGQRAGQPCQQCFPPSQVQVRKLSIPSGYSQALLIFLNRREALTPIGAVEVLGIFWVLLT